MQAAADEYGLPVSSSYYRTIRHRSDALPRAHCHIPSDAIFDQSAIRLATIAIFALRRSLKQSDFASVGPMMVTQLLHQLGSQSTPLIHAQIYNARNNLLTRRYTPLKQKC